MLSLWFLPAQAQVQGNAIQDSVSLVTPVKKGKYTLNGIVKDKQTGEIVPYATVFFQGTSIGTFSDENGRFILTFDKAPGTSNLNARLLGYGEAAVKIDLKNIPDEIVIELEPSGALMNEVVIHAGENPAITLIKKVIERKPYNNPDKADNYGYESYNKIELDIVNLSKKQFQRLPIPFIKQFSFIYDNLDTTSGKDPFLPFFLIESISDYYYQRKPLKKREIIKANLIRGIKNESITQYTGMMYLAINPYDNFIPFFDKQIPSPLSNLALSYYKYKIKDTLQQDGYQVIELSFQPLRKGTICLSGTLRIVDSVFALSYISASLPNDANVNWVKDASFYKEYSPLGDSLWFCNKENITAELQVDFMKLPGLIGRKTSYYKDIKVNDTLVERIVNDPGLKDDVIVTDTARDKPNDFWEAARHDTLSKNESAIYKMFDSVENSPVYNKFKKTLQLIGGGYYQHGPLEYGPYWSLYTNNVTEGHRFRFSVGTTPLLFKNIYIFGYGAYGTQDRRFKYFLSGFWLLKRQPQPRMYIAASYKSDIDYTVQYYDKMHVDNILNMAIRKRGVPLKLLYTNEALFEYHADNRSGFSQHVSFSHKDYTPYNPLPSSSIYTNYKGLPVKTIINAEIGIRLRYAFNENFIEGDYYRVSLGSKYPIPEIRYQHGIKGIYGSMFNYDRISISVVDDWRIAPLGKLYVNVFAGKNFNTLPYNLLETHPGNENLFYNQYAFSLMNQYEYLSDEYAGINLEHSVGGGLFTYIPLVKKLHLRQFWTAKAIVSNLSDANSQLNMNKGFEFKSLQGHPYIEVGTGIENILHIFRVDFVWRLKPTPIPAEPRSKYFGVFGSMKFDF